MTARGRHEGPAVVLEFAELAKHAPFIRGALRKLGVRFVDIDDATQDVLLGAWKSMAAGRFRPAQGKPLDDAVRVWLFGIAFRTASHYHARAFRRHERPTNDLWSFGAAPTVDPLDTMAVDRLVVLVSRLPPWARDVLVLAASGHGMTEIARALGLPLHAAGSRLLRGRRLLRRALAREPR